MTEEQLANYDNLKIEKLPEAFVQGNLEYRLLRKTKTKFLYAIFDSKTRKHCGYQVFKNKIVDFQQHYAERSPLKEDFENTAWSYSRLDVAKEKYDSLP